LTDAAVPPPAPSAAALEIEQVRDNLYLLRGGGKTFPIGGRMLPQAGTSLVFVKSRGVVLVDTKLPGWGTAICEKIREITDQPVTTVINTHAHFDHVGGNPEMPDGVDFVAHESTARLMAEMRAVSGGPAQPNVFTASGGRGLPGRTFRDRLTIGHGEERVELHFFGRAHTAGDAFVVFPAARLVHAGDVFAHKAVPPIDVNNGASGVEYPRTLARAVAALSDIETVVTGHYPTTLTMADLQTYARFTQEFVGQAQAARRAGATVDDFVKAWTIPEPFSAEGYVDLSHLRPIRPDVEAVWNETKVS
jgi:cyclase